MRPGRLSVDNIAYIRSHRDMTRKELARMFGVTPYAISYWRNSSRVPAGYTCYPEDFRQRAMELYVTHSAQEVAEMMGAKQTTISHWAQKRGVRHDTATVKRLRKKARAASKEATTRQSYVNGQIKRARTYRMERFRLLSGMERKTNIRISMVPKKIAHAMYNACYRRNYFRMDSLTPTLYYDEQTRRGDYCEAILTKRYGIKFVSAMD